MSSEEYFDDGVEEQGNTGELRVQSCELGECKELTAPAPIQASLCRKGVFVMLKDCPCKVADLKISKTGKHGSTKANMVGYDVVTGNKKQVTVPGHTQMWEFTPQKMEYEVADISGEQITAMTPEGEEKFFMVPPGEVGENLIRDFKANAEKNGDAFYLITVLYAPRGAEGAWKANMHVESYKQGKME